MVYLLHFDTRYKHAGHYLGSTCRLDGVGRIRARYLTARLPNAG